MSRHNTTNHPKTFYKALTVNVKNISGFKPQITSYGLPMGICNGYLKTFNNDKMDVIEY